VARIPIRAFQSLFCWNCGGKVIQLNRESDLNEIRKGLFAAFQKGRAETNKKVIVVDKNNKV